MIVNYLPVLFAAVSFCRIISIVCTTCVKLPCTVLSLLFNAFPINSFRSPTLSFFFFFLLPVLFSFPYESINLPRLGKEMLALLPAPYVARHSCSLFVVFYYGVDEC